MKTHCFSRLPYALALSERVLIVFFFCFWSPAFLLQVQAQQCNCNREQDSLALVALYNSTNGDNWTVKTNWLDANQPIHTWFEVTCFPPVATGCVKTVKLNANNLNGTLPVEIGNFSCIEDILLQENLGLTGDIPAALGDLTFMTDLNLSDCNFSSNIPPELGNITALVNLDLDNNDLTGTIPDWSNFPNIIKIDLSDNLLGGPIPAGFGSLTNISFLELFNNNLEGEIPAALCNLTNAVGGGIRLYDNNLSGCFPPCMYPDLCSPARVNSTNNPLLPWQGNFNTFCAKMGNQTGAPCNNGVPPNNDRIDANCNCVDCYDTDKPALIAFYKALTNTGNLNWDTSSCNVCDPNKWPGVTCNMNNRVEILKLDYKGLAGTIANEVGNLSQLKFFILEGNDFTGNIPNTINNLTLLQDLNLSRNELNDNTLPSLNNLNNLDQLTFRREHFQFVPLKFKFYDVVKQCIPSFSEEDTP